MSRDKFLAIFLLIAIGVAIAWLFSGLLIEDAGIAIDWKQIWRGTRGFQAQYGSTELRTPPWALPILWPLTLLPLPISWGLAVYATLVALLISVPRHEKRTHWIASAILLATTYPSLRQLTDGNLEALVIAGVLLILYALEKQHSFWLAIGILLTAAKIQASWLLLIILGVHLLRQWPRRKLLPSLGWVVAIAAPFMLWKGAEWLTAMITFPWPGTAIDSSLQATIARWGFPSMLSWVLRGAILLITIWPSIQRGARLNRLETGWLTSAGLLLAPYAASNSVLTPLALGVIPFLQKSPRRGIALLALFNLPYLALGRPELRANWESSYWTVVLLITWITLRNAD